MVKKKTTKQNIAIIVLSILLLLSIAFGATYSYFSGSSDELTSGSVTTATLTVGLEAVADGSIWGSASEFELHTSGNILPGQPLQNTALQISNASPVATYMAVIYTLEIASTNEDGSVSDDFTSASATMDVMDLKEDAVGDGWRKYVYMCNDGASKIHALVYLGSSYGGQTVTAGQGDGIFPAASGTGVNTSLVLHAGSLVVPKSWENDMQGKTIRVNFVAHVIQAEALDQTYPDVTNSDVNTRTSGIASAIIKEFSLDKTVSA